ncbi:MAG: tetratricopeptide repeat protein [Deltaproteobacteria bacterium]|nr:tetratricopeptide repeat protein [Deltaproteobacteria bacterium]
MSEHDGDTENLETQDAERAPREMTDEVRAQLAELDEAYAKFEGQKRWSDVIRTLLAKADLVVEADEEAELVRQAGVMYIERSRNQAEAIKCFERLLALIPGDLEALTRLKESYEKRRDWENLIGVMRKEAQLLDEVDRPARYVEMAQLATQRLRKPAICIELWQEVLEADPNHPEALEALAQLYERAREFEPLAAVLEKLAEATTDEAELKKQLQKLGMIYADKVGDDAGAIRAFTRLLEIDPDDRRAQEQLKRRYVAQGAWDELEDFYARGGKWDELIRILEREAEGKERELEEKVALLFRAAQLWLDKKEKPDRAARAYEKVLAADPTNLAAAEALSPIYEDARDARKLAAVYEVRLGHDGEPEARIALLRETALLYEEKLRGPDTAFEKYLEAFAIAPSQEILREDVARLAEATEGWDRVVAAYAQAIEAASEADPDQALALRVDLGGILSRMGKIDDAIVQYSAVVEERGDHEQAIAALGDLYRQTERYADLLAIFDRRIELTLDADARRALAYERAALLVEQLADPDAAIGAYEGILSEWGDAEAEAFRHLDGLYESRERYQDLADILERRIEIGPESAEELAALKFRQGRVLEEHLADKGRAVELYREVLTLLPEHDGARESLESLLGDAEVAVAAARILEPVYEVTGNGEMLVKALRVLHDGSDSPDERLELLTKIGAVLGEQLQDPARAFAVYAEALREVPQDENTLARLEGLAIEHERFADLVALIESLASDTMDEELARSLWTKAARIHDVQLEDVDHAVAAYRKVLDLDPGDAEVLSALELLYRRTERWSDLLGVLRRRAELAGDPADKEELLSQMAAISDTALEDPDEAIRLQREILEMDPTSQAALAALDTLFARRELWADLADNVDRQLELATEEEQQLSLMLRSAQLREERMDAVPSAVEIYREVLERQQTNPDALAALERLLDAHQLVVAEILEPIYRSESAYAKLVGIHEIQAKHSSSPEARVELLHQIAELYEVALDDPASAFTSAARALGEDPSNPRTQEELERLARATGSMEALAQVYEQRVADLEDPMLAASLHIKAAQIREESLDDAEGAIAHYRHVLELDDQCMEAADALERLYQMSERYDDLARIYLQKASMLPAPEDQKPYLFRAAATYEEILERPQDAIGVYQQVLETDPEDMGALDKLIQLYLGLERWEELLGVYTRKADIVYDPEEKKRLYAEVGAVYEREVGDVEKAIDTYQRILEIDPDDLTAIGRLDALYQATEAWQDLLSVLEREADLADDPAEVISYRYRIAELWHRRLDDAARSVDIYREILDVFPDHQPTLAALEALIAEGKEPVAAAAVLEPIYKQFGEWAKLIAVHEVQILHEEDPLQKVELLHQVAELDEFQLDQASAAFEAYARALPLDVRNDKTLGSLERLADNIGAWPRVTSLYDAAIEALREESPDDVVEMALRAAQIHQTQTEDIPAAIERYTIVLEFDPAHEQAINALDSLYEATERWPELANVLEQEIEVASSPDEVLQLQFRLGLIFQQHLGDVERAIAQFRDILGAAPEHGSALSALELLFADGVRPLEVGEILEPLYRVQEQWDRLLNVHEVQLHYQSDAIERVSMMHRMSEVAEERAGDHQKAFVWMQRALMEDPRHDHSLAEVERLSQILDGWPQLADTYAGILDGPAEADVKGPLGKRLARVYAEELEDVGRAEETYRFVLGVAPDDDEPLAALDQIYLDYSAPQALAQVLRKRAQVADIPADEVDFNFRLGQVLEADLGQTDESIRVFQHILTDLEPEHAESIRALADIYSRQANWPSLLSTFERELDVVVGDAPQAETLAKMARLAYDQLEDAGQAIELWQKVLDLRGEDPEALSALGDIYAAQENWRDLVDILDREVAVVEDDALRMAIYADLGRIWYEKLERERNALESWERVLDVDPSNAQALMHMAEIHRASGQNHELVDTLHRVIEVGAATLDDADLEGVYMQLGYLYSHELEQPMDAVEAYGSVLSFNPGNFPALDALEHIHRQEEQWEDAIGVMERRVESLTEPEARIAQLFGIAQMWASMVQDADRGTSAYQRILELEPLNEPAFERLELLHREAMRFEDLIEVYIVRAESVETTEARVALLRKVAHVYEKELDEPEQAYEALKIAWMEDFSDRETADELERVAGLTNAWNDLLTAANEALAQVEDSETKIAICLSCARWYGQELGHPEYAIPYYQQILALDPANVPAMRQMAELYRTTQQWDTLAEVLARLVDMTDNARVKAETYVQIGDLSAQQLDQPQKAGGYYQKALDADPTSVAALEALEGVYRRDARWDDLLGILERKAAAVEEPEAKLSAHLQIAEAYEDRIDDVDKAIESYSQILQTDAHHREALRGLERLYAKTERWQELLNILETQLEVATTEKEQISILTQLAGMWEEEFVKPEKAAERLESILELDPNHEAALGGLARLYRSMQRWESLVETYERHIQATPDRAEKIRLYKAMGDVYAAEMSDADRAVDCFLEVLSIDEDDAEALDALTRLYDKRGDHASALEMMEQLSKQLTDATQRVDLEFRMGRIFDEELGDRISALEHYETATDLNPAHLPSLEAKRKIQIDAGDWVDAARTLEAEAQHTETPRQKAKLLVEMGRIYHERLEERVRAITIFEAAYAEDADSEDAAMPLVDHYLEQERWEDAFPLLSMLSKRGSTRAAEEQHRLALSLGRAATELGKHEDAIKALTKAHQLDTGDLPTLMALAAAHYTTEDWTKAFKFYQMLLVHHRDSLAPDETTDTFYRLGVIKREQGERRKALNMFDKALEEDALHRPTLEAVVGLYEKQSEWEQVIHFKKQILEVAEEDKERFDILVAIGDLWREKVHNQQKAIQAYNDASLINPEDHIILHKLLVCYQETKQWEQAIDTIQQVADLDDRPKAKSKYLYTIAVVIRDELKNAEGAVDKFNEALDIDPTQLKAFEAINKIWTAKKDWKNLERAFRKMLHRILGKNETELEFNLWHNLGIIYRDRQRNFDAAAQAFDAASKLRPDDPTEHQILAELYSTLPNGVDNAIGEHQWLLRQDPYRVDSYRALYKLYFDARAYDKAWCLASTLNFLKKADAEQQQFYTQYKQGDMIRPQARVERNAWFADLFHPDEDRFVSKIMELVAPAVHAAKTASDKALNIHKLKVVDPATSTVTLARTFGFSMNVLSIPIQPRLFLQAQTPGGLAHVPGSNPPAVICGATLLSGYKPADLAFVTARFLTYYKSEHFVRTLLSSHSELRIILLAAMRISGVAPADPQVDALAQQLQQHLTPTAVDGLRQVCRKFVEAGARTDVKRWMQTVELTALRAGFLVCGDLETAARMVQALPPEGSVDLPPKDKVKELVLFSVSENYFRLREALGIQIQV